MGVSPIKLNAQSRAELEQQRLEIIKRIEEADKELSQNSASQKNTRKQIRAIENRIKDRERLISNIQNDLILAEQELAGSQAKTQYLQKDLNRVKDRYYKLLNAAYKQNLSYNKWAFILNAKSLNDSFKRWKYIKQYEGYCRAAYDQLKLSNEKVQESTVVLNESIKNRQALLAQEQVQFEKIKSERKELDEILENLKDDEASLQEELAEQKRVREGLNTAIENTIIAALKGKPIASGTVSKANSPLTNVKLSSKKGNLLWPVDNGRIISSYGRQRHPELKDVYIRNNGIDIQARIGSVGQAIFPGEVVGANRIDGYGYTIIVKHDEYYSVYSRLDKTFVESGEQVKAGQRLGLIDVDEQGQATIHFELWEGKQKLNPEVWIKK